MAATFIGFTVSASAAPTPEEFLLLLPPWDFVFTARAGGGYKDNALFSHAAPHGSGFVSVGGEAMVLRLEPSPTRFNFFASGDATRFLADPVAHDEQLAFATAQLEHEFGSAWKGSLAAQYVFQNQVLDVSVSDTNRAAVPVRGHTVSLRPGVRVELPQHWWLALEADGARQDFARPLSDYWESGLKLTVGRGYGWGSYLSLSYEPRALLYDSEPARAATGVSIPNETRLRFQQEARLTWRHHWDEQKHWRSTITLTGRLNEEKGGGYFDYIRWGAVAQLRYHAARWEVFAEGRATHYDYTTQTVSATNPEKRKRTDWSATFRCERELTRHLKLGASFEHEQVLSNDSLDTYTVNTVSGTVSWEF